MSTKKATSIRLSAEADALLATLAARLGLTKAAVIELAIRKLATAESVR